MIYVNGIPPAGRRRGVSGHPKEKEYSHLPARECETFMSNISKDDLGRMNRVNLERTIP